MMEKFSRGKNILIFIIVIALSFSGGVLASGLAANVLLSMSSKPGEISGHAGSEEPYYFETRSAPFSGGTQIVSDIVDKVGPAVVNIDVTKMEKTTLFDPFKDFERNFGFDLDPDMKDFFEGKMIPIKGAGSGFIINKSGYILTNEHVISKADKIKVTLKDGRSFPAQVIGSDATLDLAVIKIEATDLPVIKLGDSKKLRAGEFVIAIGNPYQFSNTVTLGIISAVGRNLEDIGKRDLVQTDAAINPGNSGGPLINLNGEVIGINVAIAPAAQGIGFATPINDAKDVLDDLIRKGKVTRPWLGIYMRNVDEKVAQYLDIPFAEGVVITDVIPEGPAAKAGLRRYDVIRKMDEKKVLVSEDVQKMIRNKKPGEPIAFSIYRDGHNVEVNVKLGEAPK